MGVMGAYTSPLRFRPFGSRVVTQRNPAGVFWRSDLERAVKPQLINSIVSPFHILTFHTCHTGWVAGNATISAMTHHDPAVLRAALEALARTWNRLDPGILEPWLAEGIRYESLDTDLLLEGKTTVLDHLTRKVDLIEMVGPEARMRIQIGWVPGHGGQRKPCLISAQGDVDRSALFFVSVGPDGLIDRIVLSTSDPDPRSAEASGIFPA